MSPEVDYSVLQIPTLLTPSLIQSYANLRLRSLQVNPEAFGSTYAREASFREEDWAERLDPRKHKATFIASIPTKGQDGEAPQGQWLGCLTVLGPNALQDIPAFQSLEDNQSPSSYAASYIIVAAWVDPEVRRQGLGLRLIAKALEWVSSDKAVDGVLRRRILLQVHLRNLPAMQLYRKAGFEVSPNQGDRDDETWMVYYI